MSHRVADLACDRDGFFFRRDGASDPGVKRHVALLRQFLRRQFRAQKLHRLHGWADEFDLATPAHFPRNGRFPTENQSNPDEIACTSAISAAKPVRGIFK